MAAVRERIPWNISRPPIFDSMKKVHGMGQRERLYLRLAAILHDCGKYISLLNVGEASYDIIMATEMIGLVPYGAGDRGQRGKV